MKNLSLLLILLAISSHFSAAISFHGLGFINGNFSRAFDVSYDGSVIVGIASNGPDQTAFRWENGTMHNIGTTSNSSARSVTADGSTVYGNIVINGNSSGAKWNQGSWTYLPGTGSADGSIEVLGNGSTIQKNGVPFASNLGLTAYGISGDGSTVYGTGGSRSSFIWTKSGLTDIGDLSGGYLNSRVNSTSYDGSVIVGRASSVDGLEAYRWENGQMLQLNRINHNQTYGEAADVSDNGDVIVGRNIDQNEDESTAVLWSDSNQFGVVTLNDFLDSNSIDRDGFDLTWALAVSGDGTTLVGEGINSDGYTEAFKLSVDDVSEWSQLGTSPSDLYPGIEYSTPIPEPANVALIFGLIFCSFTFFRTGIGANKAA